MWSHNSHVDDVQMPIILFPPSSNLRMRAAVTLVLKVGQRWRTVFQRNEDSKGEEEEEEEKEEEGEKEEWFLGNGGFI